MLNIVDIFQTRTNTDDDTTEMYIEIAKAKVLAATGRTETIDALLPFILQLALSDYNKDGNEGLSSYSEGGVNESYKTEEEILAGVSRFKLLNATQRLRAESDQDEETKS